MNIKNKFVALTCIFIMASLTFFAIPFIPTTFANPTVFIDDFNDNSINFDKWSELEVNGATVAEANQRLEVTVPSGSGWAQSGLVSKYSDSMQNHAVEVDVKEFNSLSEMTLMIGNSKVTLSDPFSTNNWYRILKTSNSHVVVQRKIGWNVVYLLDIPWESAIGKLQIEISDGIISFYENGVFKYAEQYNLPSYYCYTYIFTSTPREVNYGTDAFDYFSYRPSIIPVYTDDFNDGNYDGWTVDQGTWTIQSGMLRGGSNAIIHTDTTFPSNRFVCTKMRTATAGSNPWNVAVLMIKWVNMQNQITTRIFTNGNIELIMWKNGGQVFQRTVSSGLSPYIWHTIGAVVSGTNIKIIIDGTVYFNENSNYFDDIAGSVGYQSDADCYFDDMKVAYHGGSTGCWIYENDIDTTGMVGGNYLVQGSMLTKIHDKTGTEEIIIRLASDPDNVFFGFRVYNNALWTVYTTDGSCNWEYRCDLSSYKYRWLTIWIEYCNSHNLNIEVYESYRGNSIYYDSRNVGHLFDAHNVFDFEFKLPWYTDVGAVFTIDHVKFRSMGNYGTWYTNRHEEFEDTNLYSGSESWDIVNWGNVWRHTTEYGWGQSALPEDDAMRWGYGSYQQRTTWDDPDFLNANEWSEIRTGECDVPPSYGTISGSYFNTYAQESNCDLWGNVITSQGAIIHNDGYWRNDPIEEWYIPFDVCDGEYILATTVRQAGAPTFLAQPYPPVATHATAGVCVFFGFNLEIERIDGSRYWFFDWEDPDPWGEPNNFLLEIFYVRWIYVDGQWNQYTHWVPYDCFATRTNRDVDWHRFTNEHAMPSPNVNYGFTDDIGYYCREAMDHWIALVKVYHDPLAYRISGMELRHISTANEVVGCVWDADVQFTQLNRHY